MSDAPGGGGYFPIRCMMSGRFTPAALTRTSSSPARTSGTGRSTARSTPGSPNALISIARIDRGIGGIGFSEARRGRRGHVVTREPPAQSIEIRKQNTLVDVRLVQLVADLPFQRRGNHDTAREIRVLFQPRLDVRGGAGH